MLLIGLQLLEVIQPDTLSLRVTKWVAYACSMPGFPDRLNLNGLLGPFPHET